MPRGEDGEIKNTVEKSWMNTHKRRVQQRLRLSWGQKKPYFVGMEYNDKKDFAYKIIEECYDLLEFAKTYFDYEKFACDLFMCDYWFDDGFVFRAA